MPSYYAKDQNVQNRQLKTQQLSLPLKITHNATPASVVVAVDDPSILFIKTEGTDKIGPEITLLGDSNPTYVSQVDANGLFSALIVIAEPIAKVLCAQIIRRATHGVDTAKVANVTGITALGSNIALDCDSGVDLSAADLDACLIVTYQVVAE